MFHSLRKKSPVKKLLQRMFSTPWQMPAIIICALLGNLLMLSGPALLGDAIDMLQRTKGDVTQDFIYLSLLLFLIFFSASFFSWLLNYLSTRLSARLIGQLRSDIYTHLNFLPLNYYQQTPFGEITSKAGTDIDQLNDGLIAGLPQLFSGLISLFGSIYFMLLISWQVAFLVLALTPIIYLVSSTISRRSYHMYSLESQQRAELNGLAEEAIGQYHLTRSLQIAGSLQQKYSAMNEQLYEYGQKAQFYSSLTNPSTRFVNAVTYILCGAFATYLAIQGQLTVGEVGSLLFYTNQFSKPINQITDIMTKLQAALASAEKIFQLLEEEQTEVEVDDLPELSVREGEIKFQHVSFSYDQERPLIKDLNLLIPARSKVAIVGPTGAGKTTLVNLLMRFYELNQGKITIDGQNIAGVTRDSLRRSFGMVLQDVWLYEASVMDNLKFADPTVSDEKVIEVCRKVEADSFIRRLKNGYQTIINEQSNLSLGQKQLLTVARVMLQDPPMLILDEATSAIDTVTELRVQKAFVAMLEDRTAFIIAHRLSTILDAEIILVMNEGNIVEQGTFQTLMAKDTLFKALYNSQFRGQRI